LKQKAKAFAQKAHEGQMRKGATIPYITHPILVAKRLEEIAASDELVAAGYLHDVVEDTPVTIEAIEKEFGSRVAYLVACHTEDKSKSWQVRKQHTIDTVKNAEKEVKHLIVADKLDNLLSIEKDINQQGDSIWEKFNADFDQQKWYYQSIAEYMYTGLDEADIPDFFQVFTHTVKRVFG